jgi:hypothetical protein
MNFIYIAIKWHQKVMDTVEKKKKPETYCLNIQVEFNFSLIDLHAVCHYFFLNIVHFININ